AGFEIGEAVENVAAVEIGPARHRASQEASVAGRRREVKDLLPCRQDAWANDVRKGLRQPGPEGEDESVGADGLSRRKPHLSQSGRIGGRRLDPALEIGA